MNDMEVWRSKSKDFLNLIQESFQSQTTEYGDNFPECNNMRIVKKNKSTYTFFKHREVWIMVELYGKESYNEREVVFTATTEEPNSVDDFKFGLTNKRVALYVINKVIYVLGEMLITSPNVSMLKFYGYNPYDEGMRLDAFYEKMVNNKIFSNVMKSFGFKYLDKVQNYYAFVRT